MSKSKATRSLADSLSQQKATLKNVNPVVTTLDGRRIEEALSPLGTYTTKSVQGVRCLGFVADERLDLQVGEVLPGLLVGSQDAAHELPVLEKHGVTHILNAANYVTNLDPTRFKYKNLNIMDTPETKIIARFEEAIEFIDHGRQSGCVLVHCNAGWSRAPTLCIAYVMRTMKESFEKAFERVKQARPSMCPNVGFVRQLKEWERQLERNEK